MFGPDLIGAFGELKAVFDPGDRMNPGKVVEPEPGWTEHLRLGGGWAPATSRWTLFHSATRTTAARSPGPRRGASGVGKCRGDEPAR